MKQPTPQDEFSASEDASPTIFIVDDDLAVVDALRSVGRLLELPVAAYTSAVDFLANYTGNEAGCLVLDIKMPGMTGLELQQRLNQDPSSLPVIMISGHADVRVAVEAMRQGALTVLEKPCHLDELTTHIRQALRLDRERRASRLRSSAANSQFSRLTSKEREVLQLVTDGRTNKEIASTLELSVRAVEDRRARVMKKLGAKSVVELVQLCVANQAEK